MKLKTIHFVAILAIAAAAYYFLVVKKKKAAKAVASTTTAPVATEQPKTGGSVETNRNTEVVAPVVSRPVIVQEASTATATVSRDQGATTTVIREPAPTTVIAPTPLQVWQASTAAITNKQTVINGKTVTVQIKGYGGRHHAMYDGKVYIYENNKWVAL